MAGAPVPPTPGPPVPPPGPPAPPSAGTPPPADPDAALKTRKLELEIQELERKMSRQYWGLEIFKAWAPSVTAAVTAVVAIMALFWTINAGTKQINQTQNAQDQDRFDKALTRLGSTSVSERLTGVAGLSLFLTSEQDQRHAATLRFLASALVIEKDSSVRQAILDTFSHMDPAVVRTPSREDALRTLLDLNRSTYYAILHLPASEPETQHALKEQEAALAEGITASASAILIFLQSGTAERNFSGISCEGCNFSAYSKALDLSNANFERAFLANADFSRLKLSGASFAGASLWGTKFEGADLRRSRFTGVRYALTQFTGTGKRALAPDFACADASESDFSGSLFFGVIESTIANERIAGFPDLFQTKLQGANLSEIGFYALPTSRSQSAPPFANTQVNTYKPTGPGNHEYRAMYVVQSPSWRFVPTSPAFQRSWDYLLGQLRLASGAETADLPAAMNIANAEVPPSDPHRCEQYSESQGH